MNLERRKSDTRARVNVRQAERTCLADVGDLRLLLGALRPLGQATTLTLHAAHCPRCFARLCDLFLATAPAESDPLLRIIDGVNSAVYRLAKALLSEIDNDAYRMFCFDQVPNSVENAADEALDRIAALDEYTEGRTEGSCEAKALRALILESRIKNLRTMSLVEAILKRAITIGGRHALDGANLLGFLRLLNGDLDGAELLFTTVCQRQTNDLYERETQAHAMNNLAGVHVRRGQTQSAILWSERSLMLKERLGIDARSNYLNLITFWLETSTAYAQERIRHYLRCLLLLEGGKTYLERNFKTEAYRTAMQRFRRAGFDKEFPEIAIVDPPATTTKPRRPSRKANA